jgi:hypothetical protein
MVDPFQQQQQPAPAIRRALASDLVDLLVLLWGECR